MTAPLRIAMAGGLLAALAGCADPAAMPAKGGAATPERIAAARAKLDGPERALAEGQEWCAVATKQRLGSMGVPVKVAVGGKPVLLCCRHCEKKALAHPEKTLASVEANKERAAQERAAKGK